MAAVGSAVAVGFAAAVGVTTGPAFWGGSAVPFSVATTLVGDGVAAVPDVRDLSIRTAGGTALPGRAARRLPLRPAGAMDSTTPKQRGVHGLERLHRAQHGIPTGHAVADEEDDSVRVAGRHRPVGHREAVPEVSSTTTS